MIGDIPDVIADRRPPVDAGEPFKDALNLLRMAARSSFHPGQAPTDPTALGDLLPHLAGLMQASRAFVVRVERGADGKLEWKDGEPLAVNAGDVLARYPMCGDVCDLHHSGEGPTCLTELPAVLRDALVLGDTAPHEEALKPGLARWWIASRVVRPRDVVLCVVCRDPDEASMRVAWPLATDDPRWQLVWLLTTIVDTETARALLAEATTAYTQARAAGPSAELADAAEDLLRIWAWLAWRKQGEEVAGSRDEKQGGVDITAWPDVEVTAGTTENGDAAKPPGVAVHSPPPQEITWDDIIADYVGALVYLAREATERAGRKESAEARELWARLGYVLLRVGSGTGTAPEMPDEEAWAFRLPWVPLDADGRPVPAGPRHRGPRLLTDRIHNPEFTRTRLTVAGALAWLAAAMRDGLWPPDAARGIPRWPEFAEELTERAKSLAEL